MDSIKPVELTVVDPRNLVYVRHLIDAWCDFQTASGRLAAKGHSAPTNPPIG